MKHSTPGLPVHHQLPESTQTHVHCVGNAINHLILCRPLLLLSSVFPSIRVFSNESALHIRWPKYWSFIFNISPSNGHPGLIFRMGWLDLLSVQGTLKSFLQQHSSKASILRHPAFFGRRPWHPTRTRLSNFTFTFHFHALEEEMATHSSVLAWRIPGMGEPDGLPSMGSHRVGHD